MKTREMITVVTLMAAVLVVLFIMGGCAGPGVPSGSVLEGEYQGNFKGQYSWGKIKFSVYEAPDGSRSVNGELQPEEGNMIGNFHGQMKGSRLEAGFIEGMGTVTGEMSADGKTMSGTITHPTVAGPPATWTARKK